MAKKNHNKCERILPTVAEEIIKTSIEAVVIGLILGVSVKLLIAIPALAFGAGVAKVSVSRFIN